jgi:heptaprenyl diphosphate synthase
VAAPHPLLALRGMPALRERVEKRLLAAVESGDPAMSEMASHLVRAGGKRLRPLLGVVASTAGREGGDGGTFDVGELVSDDAVTGGVVCELVHVGSLHHDDVIDEAGTRHGVDSVNARWGNLRAILSGDFLLARASELAAALGTDIAALLAATIGRLCEGELRELQVAYQVERTDDDYLAAVEGKTAALYATSCRIGGMISGLPADQVEALGSFGRHYGLAFQVVDDILDVVARGDDLGKPAGHDIAEGIYTQPVLRALAGPDGAELRSLLGRPLDARSQARALALVRRGDGVAQAAAVADGHVDAAVASLGPLSASPATDALAASARHLLTALDAASAGPPVRQ